MQASTAYSVCCEESQTRAESESYYIEFGSLECQLRTTERHPYITIIRSKSTTCHIESIIISINVEQLFYCAVGTLLVEMTADCEQPGRLMCLCSMCVRRVPCRPSLHRHDYNPHRLFYYYKYSIILLFMPANPMAFHCCQTTYFLIGKMKKRTCDSTLYKLE